MFCSKCGSPIENNSKFCGVCGNAVEDVSNQQNNFNNGQFNMNNQQMNDNMQMNNNQQMNNFDQANNNQYNGMGQSNVAQMTNNNYYQNIGGNKGGIRKEIKSFARSIPKGGIIGGFLLLVLALIVSASLAAMIMISENFALTIIGIVLFFGVCLVVPVAFMYAIISSSLRSLRGERITVGEFLSYPFRNFGRAGEYIIVMILYGIVNFLVNIIGGLIPIVGTLAALAFIIYTFPAVYTIFFIYADENAEKLSFTETVKKAFSIVKGNRIQFYAMNISFIGWTILSMLTFGLLMIWVMPYMMMSVANMYRTWIGEVNYNNTNKTGLSDGAIIGIYAGAFVLLFVLIFVLVLIGVMSTVPTY